MLITRIVQLFTVIILCLPFLAKAQVTTSSLTGIIKSSGGEVLAGATVTATHEPTGAVYTTVSRKDGRYDFVNMAPGGPYSLTTTYAGLEVNKQTELYLTLGETARYDAVLATKQSTLTEVVVTARSSGRVAKNGAETTIDREKMQTMPSVGRNLIDYLKATPQLKVTSGAYGDGGFSIAGQNNRYNSFYVDGSVNNDVFGLAASGTNGGQTSVAPISIDAIDQFQVLVSPYDATLGNFTGGAVNAITKSGSNTIHGSAYYIFRNQNLSGKTPTGSKDAATKLASFDNKTYGFTLGGPIIKNKLFYFVNAELQRDQTPNPFDLSTYRGNTNTQAALDALEAVIKSRGYDPGPGFDNNTQELKAERIAAKVDWNINQKNKLSLSYRYNKGTRIAPYASTPTQIEFYNAGYVFPTTTNSASLELKSTLGKTSTNRFLATFTNVVDDRGIVGQQAPSVIIFDGLASGGIYFGPDGSSVYNYLSQKNFNVLDHFKFNVGKHNFTAGFEAEYYKASNAFIQYIYGDYQYTTVDQFVQNSKPTQYRANFNLIDNQADNTTNGAAKFDVAREALFFNDEIRSGENFTITLGLRADMYQFVTKPLADKFATDTAMPKFAQYYDMKEALPGQKPNIPVSISPRIGFNYKLPDENLVIRGGLGLFSGRIPLVWPGGIYNNTGITGGGYTLSSSLNTAIWNQDKVDYRLNPYTPAELGINLSDAKGNLNLISKKFKMPKVFRASLAVDKNWGKGWTTTIEGMFTKNINDVYYYNVNLLPPTATMVGPDTRKVYPASNAIPLRTTGVLNPYSGAYLLANAEGDKPFSYNFTLSVNRSSRTGVNFYAAYNYGESFVLNEAQSSTNNSQWGSQETVNGRNFLNRSISDNSVGHRIFSVISKRFQYADKKLATTISLSYTGQSGQPFSFVSSGQLVRDGQSGYDLAYIPTASDLQNMIFLSNTIGTTTYTPQQQKDALETYISTNEYLNSRRGQYAERNGSRLPFTNNLDLKLAQDFNIKLGNAVYTVQVAYSMFNFTNFLNRDWGRQYFQGTDQVTLLTFASYVNAATNLTPQYRFNPTLPAPGAVTTSTVPTYSSRWLSQLEFRIRF